MVTQEGAPSLGGRPGSLDHVLRDAGLSDFKAEFEQLAMDTRGAPQWIVSAHPSDQRAQVRVDLRSTSIRELDATIHHPLQHNQLMSECRVLCLKSALRLERRGEQGQEEAEQRDHRR